MEFIAIYLGFVMSPNGGICDTCGVRNPPGFGMLTCSECGADMAPDRVRDAKPLKTWYLLVFWGIPALTLCVVLLSNSDFWESVRAFRIPLSKSSGP